MRFELERDEMRLLRDPHGRARVAAAELDDARERGVRDGAAVLGEARRHAGAPLLGLDRAEGVEAPEAAEGPPARGEQVPHHVLDASREQVRDRRGALEDGAHAVGDRLRIAVRLPRGGQLLELVEEEDQLLPVGHRHTLGELEREIERALRILGGKARGQRELHALPQLTHHLQHGARLRRGSAPRGPRYAPGAARGASRSDWRSRRPRSPRPAHRHPRGGTGRASPCRRPAARAGPAPPRRRSSCRFGAARPPRDACRPGAGSHLGDVVGRPISCPAGTGESVGNRRPLGRRRWSAARATEESLHIICVNDHTDCVKPRAGSLTAWPTGWLTRPLPTSSSTRTTPWTGTRGARRRSRARVKRSGRYCSRSATRRATGATSWSGSRSRIPRSPR